MRLRRCSPYRDRRLRAIGRWHERGCAGGLRSSEFTHMSDAANWSRVRELFHRALDLDPAHRADFLRDACSGDASLHAEVSSLLAAHADAGSVVEGSPFKALDASAVSSLLNGLRVGDRLGPYDIVGKLGAGGMGE